MLKDAFNRKKRQGQAEALPPADPAEVPTVAAKVQAAPGVEEETVSQSALTTQSLAAMTLQRLGETFDARESAEQAAREAAEAAQAAAANVVEPLVGPYVPPEQKAKACDLSGTLINDLYRIDGVLAKGGMGQVLLCWHMRREIYVVMKLMLKTADSGDPAFQRFMQECRVTDGLKHPNLVKVLDYSILLEGHRPYLVMEYVDGASLRNILRRKFALMPTDIAQILIQAAEGLSAVHAKNIIHRDLKPENIMVRGDFEAADNVKILDFGIAQLQDRKFDEEGWAIGSIGYMSPEQVCGHPVDYRTDIYSLGLMLYEAIAGRPPFKGKTPKETMAMHVKAPLVPPSQIVHCENAELIDHICKMSLAKDPKDRYTSVREMQEDLLVLVK